MAKARRPMLVGTLAEHQRVLAIARMAVERHPQSGRVLDGILSRLARATAAADRAAVRRPPAEATPRPVAPPAGIAYAGSAASVLMLIAAGVAGLVEFLPGRNGDDPTRDVDLRISAVNAGVAAVLALLGGAALARDRHADRQSWKVYLGAAAALALGLAWGARRAGGDRAEYGGTWSVWLAANTVALAVVLLVALLLRRRSGRAPARPWSPRDEAASTEAALNTARAEIDTLLLAPERRARVVEDAWRAGLDDARRRGEISAAVAADARSTTPYRWQMEMAADPELSGTDSTYPPLAP